MQTAYFERFYLIKNAYLLVIAKKVANYIYIKKRFLLSSQQVHLSYYKNTKTCLKLALNIKLKHKTRAIAIFLLAEGKKAL